MLSTKPAVSQQRIGTSMSFTDSVMDALTCPICLEPLSPPVYQCQNGHAACASCCILKLKGICVSCLLPIGGNRCVIVEKIIESLEINCKYAVWGCKKMLQYTKLRKRTEHEDVCEFRPFHCPVEGCNHEGPKLGLPMHFQKNHNGMLVLVEPQPNAERKASFIIETEDGEYDRCYSQYVLVQVSRVQGPKDQVSEYESLFLVHHQFDKKLCRCSFSCTSFGEPDMSKRYRLSVDTERTGSFKVNHTIEGPIFDNQEDKALPSKVVRRGDCLLVPKLFSTHIDGLFSTKKNDSFEVQLSLL